MNTLTNKWLEDFNKYIKLGNEGYIKAAEILVDRLDIDRSGTLRLIGGSLSTELLSRLERLGRGQLDVRLLFPNWLTRKLSMSPIEVQRKVLEHGINCVVPERPDEVVVIPVERMTRKMMQQAFCSTGVRGVEQQREYLNGLKEAAIQRQVLKEEKMPTCRVVGRTLVVDGHVTLGVSELLEHLKTMKVTVSEVLKLMTAITEGS